MNAIRVIFVDDEPRVLEGLKRMLRPKRNEWQMTFVGSAQAALDALRAEPCEVVVTDMRMPGMNGAELSQASRTINRISVEPVLRRRSWLICWSTRCDSDMSPRR